MSQLLRVHSHRLNALRLAAFAAFILLNFLGQSSFADFKTPPVESDVICSSLDPNVCAHLHFMTALKNKTPAAFAFHAETPQDQEIKDLQVSLKTQTQTSAYPVTITLGKGLNQYRVTNAIFDSAGKWLIQTRFMFGATEHHIDFEVEIQ